MRGSNREVGGHGVCRICTLLMGCLNPVSLSCLPAVVHPRSLQRNWNWITSMLAHRSACLNVLLAHRYALELQAIIRAVCVIIDAFHFDLPASGAAPEPAAAAAAHGAATLVPPAAALVAADGVDDTGELAASTKHDAEELSALEEAAVDVQRMQADILRTLVKRVLPALSEQLVVKNEA